MKNGMLEAIYLAYYHEVFLYTLSLCGNVHTAEDLTSETFYRALLSLDGQQQNVKFWLFKVSRNLFYDRLRKEARIGPEMEEDIFPSGLEDVVWTQMLKSEEARELFRAVLNLPPRSRVCLKIHFRHLHAPLRGIFGPNSVSVAHYASFIGAKSPAKCDAHLSESNFQTHPREAIYMFYFLNYRIKEIAALTGQKPGAVKTVLCRARKQLKESLKEGIYGI